MGSNTAALTLASFGLKINPYVHGASMNSPPQHSRHNHLARHASRSDLMEAIMPR